MVLALNACGGRLGSVVLPSRLSAMSPAHAWLVGAGSLSLMVLVLAACGAPRPEAGGPSGRPSLRVVTTFLPITLFTRAVAGDCATVTALVPANSGPHDFQAKPGDLAMLRRARLLVKNGLGMESFLDKLITAAGNPRLTVIDSSRGIATLEFSPGNANHHHGFGGSHRRDHGRAEDHGHDHSAENPHIWLDPLRAVQQVNTIRDGLVNADPGCADGYRRNAAAFAAQLLQLNSEIASQLKPYRGKTFVAFHDFAPYFAQRYGLRAEYLVDVPELNPSPADLRRVAAEVKQTQLKALLSEPQQGQRSFNSLAEDLGVTISVFDPMETGSAAASRDPATYGRVMRRNVAELIQAFAG